ncbi:hypothetical protein DEO72_LG4g1403 [Vigna unguiculata]|uniref:Uncharacterized protein n=1 Tax=Vigna unguiculata TaxID=3917 RepID=A0A4D6LPE6_VIGUN|nr:hypothetical protein DEO72_LG4g1403 [Vigna unguiculata]
MAMATAVLCPQNITDKAIVRATAKTTKTVNKDVETLRLPFRIGEYKTCSEPFLL